MTLNGLHCLAAEYGNGVLATAAAGSAKRIRKRTNAGWHLAGIRHRWIGTYDFRQPTPELPFYSYSRYVRARAHRFAFAPVRRGRNGDGGSEQNRRTAPRDTAAS